MKKLFDSIANRVFLILLAGIVVAIVVTTWLANYERQNTMRDLRNQHLAEKVEQIVDALDDATPQERPQIVAAARDFGFEAHIGGVLPATANGNPDLVGVLKSQLGDDRKIVSSSEAGCTAAKMETKTETEADTDASAGTALSPAAGDTVPRRGRHGYHARQQGDTCEVVDITLRDGAVLSLILRPPDDRRTRRGGPPNGMPLGPYTLLFLALIAILAYAVAKIAARPIKQLAIAAGRLGQDIDQPPLPERGPAETRQAALAFNLMQARIRRQIQHRTHMLAAITHDLQTPLTRLRLRLEKVGDTALREKLVDDLASMQQMVREGLDLARSMDSSEAMQRLDIDSLLDSVCADATDAGQEVTLSGRSSASIVAQPNALRRCLTNLLDNAVKYGQSATVTIGLENGKVAIRIRDQGTGIPQDQLEAVFEPFYRLETSRSRETGGTGLGLTIARNIAERHGATLQLENIPGSGLQASLLLPLPLTSSETTKKQGK